MNSVINDAVQSAYDQISNDTKFIRLTTITTLIHSIIFLGTVGLNVSRIIAKNSHTDSDFSGLVQMLGDIFSISGISGRLIGLSIILGIGYFFLPPIGEASLIHYLADDKKKGSKALARGFGSFFPMFEFNGIISVFTPLLFIIFASRFWVLDILNNFFIIVIVVLWGLLVVFASIFLPYTKYYIVLEDMKPFDAMKKSMSLALTHLATTLRGTFLQYVLAVRFIINLLLFLGLPLLILYAATQFNIQTGDPMSNLIIIVLILTGLLIAYINGIIEAFFITLRYRLFVQLK